MSEWQKVIAVDFDGCLCENRWPDIGEARWKVINELLRQQAEGAKLILWTCREGQLLQAAVLWCLNRGIRFDAVNDNLESNKEHYGNNSRKVSATEYWDDRSVLIVNAGLVTSIISPKPDGGMIVRQWQTKEMQFISPPREGTFRRKRWWERWIDKLTGSSKANRNNSRMW